MSAPLPSEHDEIEAARAFLRTECGVSVPRDDAVLLAYLLVRRGIGEGVVSALENHAGAVKTFDHEVADHTSALKGAIDGLVDATLATMMAGVEKRIDEKLRKFPDHSAGEPQVLRGWKTQESTPPALHRLWPILIFYGALSFAGGAVALLTAARYLS